jgi:hypothetical protein
VLSLGRHAAKVVLVTALLAVMALPAVAAPPPGTDLSSSNHAWFERQHSVRGSLCCAESDGHVLPPDDWRTTGAAYEVRINGHWFELKKFDKLTWLLSSRSQVERIDGGMKIRAFVEKHGKPKCDAMFAVLTARKK